MENWITQLLAAIIGGVSVYTGIRADLAEMKARILNVEKSAEESHRRIDRVMERD